MRFNQTILALVAILQLQACHTMTHKAEERRAIESVLRQDRAATDKWLKLFLNGESLNPLRGKTDDSKTIDLTACPEDFQIAYRSHNELVDDYLKKGTLWALIPTLGSVGWSWDHVHEIAEKHGVDWRKIEAEHELAEDLVPGSASNK